MEPFICTKCRNGHLRKNDVDRWQCNNPLCLATYLGGPPLQAVQERMSRVFYRTGGYYAEDVMAILGDPTVSVTGSAK